MSIGELLTSAAKIRAQIDARTLDPAYGWLEFVAKLDARATELERDAMEASSHLFAMTVNRLSSRHGEDG